MSTCRLDGHEIELSNLDKTFFPEAEISKGELIDYYRQISPCLLPHLEGRPLTLQRFPDGIEAEGFFQKSMPDYFPDWFERHKTQTEEGEKITYPVCDSTAALVYIAQQGCITPHVWLSRTQTPDCPDQMVFDLDPADEDFAKVMRAAKLVRTELEEWEMPAFVMTTGSRGLHVRVPLKTKHEFERVRKFARRIASRLVDNHSDLLTTEQRKSKREGRIFVDVLRNARGQTAVPPYAVRAKSEASIAAPLAWNELGSDLHPRRYHLGNIFRRLGQRDDPWRDFYRHAIDLGHRIEQLEDDD